MSAFMMDPKWARKPTGLLGEASSGHMLLAYSARYTVKDDVVEHAVDLASDPRFIGEILRRRVLLSPREIVLETLASVGRDTRDSKHQLTWRKTD